MSVTDQNGWGEVERRAAAHERNLELINREFTKAGLPLVEVTPVDRLKGAIIAAIGELELGHRSSAQQILEDSLKIGGVK